MSKQSEDRHYSGRGDPARSMALLWREGSPARGRGPRPALTVERIVAAAIEIADAEGLAATSMRRVAGRLGVGTMSLYTYVPGKAELIDVMFDTVCGELQPPWAGTWRERLELIARASLEMYRRHPWMLTVAAASRPPLGPNSIANYDRELRAIEGIGLSDLEMDSVITTIHVYVQGVARTAIEAAGNERATGQSDLEWWNAYAPLLAKVLDEDRYPTATRVGTAAGETHQAAYDPDHAFHFGLARILDGVAALLH